MPVFENFSFCVNSGRFAALIGPSGCGKTTLLRLIAGLERPDKGELQVEGATVAEGRRAGLLSLALQDPGLLPWRSVAGNVKIAAELRGRNLDGVVDELLEIVRLSHARNLRPHQLSSGMRQRVALARALAADPRVLLLDEPLANVDELTRLELLVDLERLWMRTQPTTLFVTHSVEEAVWLADEVFVMVGRPVRIAACVDVPFERPRSVEIMESDDFRTLAASIRGLLRTG